MQNFGFAPFLLYIFLDIKQPEILAVGTDRTDDIREKRLISKIYFIIFPFLKDLAVLYREKCIKGRVQIQNFAYMKGTGI
jgi:hypothetical protein